MNNMDKNQASLLVVLLEKALGGIPLPLWLCIILITVASVSTQMKVASFFACNKTKTWRITVLSTSWCVKFKKDDVSCKFGFRKLMESETWK